MGCCWGLSTLGGAAGPQEVSGQLLSAPRGSLRAGLVSCQAGVRALTMVHLAGTPGLPIQPQTITALQPQAQRSPGAGGQEGSRWASGVGFPAQWGQPRREHGEGSGSSLPASGSSQPLLPEGGWEGQGGRWGRGLSGHHHCHLEQGGGETGPTPGLSRGVGFSSVRGILRRLDSGPTAIGEAHRTTLGLSFLVRTTGVHLRRIHGTLASCRARLRAPEK